MRFLLYPFSLIYGLAVLVRNLLYQFTVFSKTSFPLPIIGVGNLRVGGTGKTPMTELILRSVSNKFQTGVLSRGYGRKTSGFLLATSSTNTEDIGDEPSQMMKKFPIVSFAVDENRVSGVKNLIRLNDDLELIVLDDVFQHKAISPGLMILLTAYGDLYIHDHIMPAGMLREHRSNAGHADIIVVTKCPNEISAFEQRSIIQDLNSKTHQKVFFACEEYGLPKAITKTKTKYDSKSNVILLTGIASSERLKMWLSYTKSILEHLDFPDHHWFTEKDLDKVKILQERHDAIVVTTEKDAQRLQTILQNERFANLPIFYLPIEMAIMGEGRNQFNECINEFIRSY